MHAVHSDLIGKVKKKTKSRRKHPLLSEEQIKTNIVNRANTLHSGKYDYSIIEHTTAKLKVSIICPIHGVFKQRLSAHLDGQGCPHCNASSKTFRSRCTFESFFVRANKTHVGKYTYKPETFTGMTNQVVVVCPEHGEFKQIASNHVARSGCPTCSKQNSANKSRSTLESFIDRAIIKHGNRYDYSQVEYVDSSHKVKIICPEHGVFEQLPQSHLSGNGCKKCAASRIKNTRQEFVDDAKFKFGDKFDYSRVNYVDPRTNVDIICPIHGLFQKTPYGHITSIGGCPSCTIAMVSLPVSKFIEKAQAVHGDVYDYSKVTYINSKAKVEIICPTHGSFWQTSSSHVASKNGCRRCSATSSTSEKEIISLLEEYRIGIEPSYRLNPKTELDIYLPDHKLAIEYNGLYYHSSHGLNLKNKKSTSYHKDKFNLCREQEIELLQIFEDEWVNPVKRSIWESIIKHKLGLTTNKIYARKCQIVELDYKSCSTFLEENHLMGKDSSPIRYGLIYNNQLVSVITFGKPSLSGGNRKYNFNIGRFSILKDTTVVGGFSKLLKHFLKLSPNVTLSTAADLRYSTGNVYTKNGFKLTHETKPNYWYWNGSTAKTLKRLHRFGFRKQLLGSKLEKFDPSLTEKQNMISHKWNIIYDAGNAMFEYVNESN